LTEVQPEQLVQQTEYPRVLAVGDATNYQVPVTSRVDRQSNR